MLLAVAHVGLALLLANTDATPTARDFGLCRPRFARAVALMFAVFIGVTAVAVLWSAALGLDDDAGSPLADRLGTEGTLNVLILVVVVTVLAPLTEEFIFRGYIFRALRNWRGVWPAAITTGVLFAASHIGWLPLAAAVPATVFGIGMCLLYHWTGSLYPCIAVHAIMNSIALGGVLNVAGAPADRWIDARGAGDLPADRPPSRRHTPQATQPARRCASRPRELIERGPPRPGGQVRGALRGRARSSSSSPRSRACCRRRRGSTRPRRRGVGSRQARHARRSPGAPTKDDSRGFVPGASVRERDTIRPGFTHS